MSTNREREREQRTFETGVWFVFGCMPMAEAFARIIPFLGENFSKHSNGRASPETACARAFALSFKRMIKSQKKNKKLPINLKWIVRGRYQNFG